MTESSVSDDDTQSIIEEANLFRIRNAVNENKIKLWIAPYYDKEKPEDDEKLLELSQSLSPTLDLDIPDVLWGLKQLQRNALEKLEARDNLAKSNEMMVKVKISKSKQSFNITVDGNFNVSVLIDEISKKITGGSNANSTYKLISGGKTLSNEKTLLEQGLKPGATVMALKVEVDNHTMAIVEEQRRILKTARSDAELLLESDELEVTDQEGNRLALPKAEKDAMVLAMSLHEKGRAAMRNSDYDLALILLTDAADEYQQVRNELLRTVDNYALLNLDIAWTYLRLGNLSELPNATKCLAECEANFARTYGANLERVEAIKGSKGEEGVLLVRMHLLQAIVSFHSGQTRNAKDLFNTVTVELVNLQVPQESLDEVMAAGFTKLEARLALRSVKGDVAKAIKYATEVGERRDKIEQEEYVRAKRRKKFGKTGEGDWVNLGYVDTMTKMGYDESMAAKALAQVENDMNEAIELINTHPEWLMESFQPHEITKEMTDQIVSMGFPIELVKQALVKFKGNAERALEALTSGFDLDGTTSSSSEDGASSSTSQSEESMAKKARTEEAKARFRDDLEDSDGYLDLDLDDEKVYLDKYLKILNSK